MTPGKLYELGAEPVASNTLRPLGTENLILGTHHGSASNSGEFGKRKRHGVRVRCLGSKPVDGSLGKWLITVSEEQRTSNFEVDPCAPQLRVGLTQPRIAQRIQHVGFVTQLIGQAPADVRDRGAQVHQMPHRSTSRDQRNRTTAEGVPDQQHIVVAPIESSANHVGVGIKARRPVIAGQIHRDHIMAGLLQERNQQLPAPRPVPSTVRQGKRRHAVIVGATILATCENGTGRPAPCIQGSPGDQGADVTVEMRSKNVC
jgi:hypothetical protein